MKRKKKKKKSYNPFRMWGSYVGAFIGFFAMIFYWNAYVRLIDKAPNILFEVLANRIVLRDILINNIFQKLSFVLQPLTNALIWLVIGFLIGWGIHSLIRRLRK